MNYKKHPNGNHYLLTPQNMWVRNFNLPSVPFIDINNTINKNDHAIFLKNEIQNGFKKYQWIDSENLYHPNIVIVSDGYNFKEKHKILSNLPKSVVVIGVNGSLAKWEVKNRNLTYYVVNNPYPECMKFFPRSMTILPKCIASPRTNSDFLNNYRGTKYRYYPVNEHSYTTLGHNEVIYQIDDYRNPICAAIGLAFKFGVERLLLVCCDDAFENERPGCVKLPNGLYMYPQHEIAHGLIDGNLHWLKNKLYQETYIKNHSSGLGYENAEYINESEILSFFGINDNEKT